MKHALVVFNPVSGHKKWGNVPQAIQKALRSKGYDYTWYETQPKQNLDALFESYYDLILVSGGDGTVAEVVCGMLQKKLQIPIVVLPQGSANLLALSLGLPLFPVSRALSKGLEGRLRTLDVMRVNGKHFAMIAVGRGYDAFLMQHTTRALKQRWGLWAYVGVLFKTAFFYRPKVYHLNVDGKRSSVLARSVMVFNMSPFPFLKMSPEDGLLNVFVLSSKGVLEAYTGKKISIKGADETKFQLDGEVFKSKSITVEVLPRALSIFC